VHLFLPFLVKEFTQPADYLQNSGDISSRFIILAETLVVKLAVYTP